MQGQQLFRSVRSGRTGYSFRVTGIVPIINSERDSGSADRNTFKSYDRHYNRSVGESGRPFLVGSDTRLSVRSTENSQGQNHSQPISIREGEGGFRVDDHIPATRPRPESEPTIGRTELLRWSAYLLGILLFVGGITVVLF
jgi:hypothetical protein